MAKISKLQLSVVQHGLLLRILRQVGVSHAEKADTEKLADILEDASVIELTRVVK